MSKRKEVKEKDYVVRRIFENTSKSILDIMLEHFEPDWSLELVNVESSVPENEKSIAD